MTLDDWPWADEHRIALADWPPVVGSLGGTVTDLALGLDRAERGTQSWRCVCGHSLADHHFGGKLPTSNTREDRWRSCEVDGCPCELGCPETGPDPWTFETRDLTAPTPPGWIHP